VPGLDEITAGLNPAQAEAVRHVEGPLLVLAGRRQRQDAQCSRTASRT